MADLHRKIERKLSDIEVCISRAKARGNKQRVVQLIQEKLTRQKQLKNLK